MLRAVLIWRHRYHYFWEGGTGTLRIIYKDGHGVLDKWRADARSNKSLGQRENGAGGHLPTRYEYDTNMGSQSSKRVVDS